MSSAVDSLQAAIVSGDQSLTQLLRQTKLIASKLGIEDVEQWVNLELNGYPTSENIPEYREVYASSLQIHHPMYGWQFAGNLGIKTKALQPISEVESWSQGEAIAFPVKENFPVHDQIGSSMAADWPQRFIIAGSQYKRIVEAVKNKLLEWTTELERRGIKGENMNFDERERRSASSQIFNIGSVHGQVGTVSDSPICINDYSSVHQLLVDSRISKQERRELEDIMDELKEAPPAKKQTLLERGERWVVKHKEILGAGAEIIGRALRAAAGNQ